MNFVFGPVPSRRLGQSLGIDTIPLKTCNWNCVYCQLGRSVPLVNQRRNYFLPEAILAEVQMALAAYEPGEIDWITFVGSGEPTLHAGIGLLIRQVKALTDRPVAVITNGALLYLPELRTELIAADAVLPTLDAGTPKLYRTINRPHPDITFERLVRGLIAFREQYTGKLWIEVMLVRGLNDAEPALQEIAAILRQIEPDAIHINLPIRPPAEPWVQPPDENALRRALTILGDIAQMVRPAQGTFNLAGGTSVSAAMISLITRHPMSDEELRQTLKQWAPQQVEEVLTFLLASGQAQVVERSGTHFWSAAASHYPDDSHSSRVMPAEHS
jgi:wyosine [tRNA(Phe)-imidazoG37] synthetase (radical SAM superfamily)